MYLFPLTYIVYRVSAVKPSCAEWVSFCIANVWRLLCADQWLCCSLQEMQLYLRTASKWFPSSLILSNFFQVVSRLNSSSSHSIQVLYLFISLSAVLRTDIKINSCVYMHSTTFVLLLLLLLHLYRKISCDSLSHLQERPVIYITNYFPWNFSAQV